MYTRYTRRYEKMFEYKKVQIQLTRTLHPKNYTYY
jgi:hypothetical protein